MLNPWNVDALAEIEKETGGRVWNILQLRHHPAIIGLREKVRYGPADKVYDVDLTYMTSRGRWYHISWKGDVSRSGGITTNIGIHFFDMLIWVFGEVKSIEVYELTEDTASGYIQLERARVRWTLSIDYDRIPEQVRAQGKRTFRSLQMDGEEIEFSDGFTELHTRSYQAILEGNGFGLEAARPCIELAYQIRNSPITSR